MSSECIPREGVAMRALQTLLIAVAIAIGVVEASLGALAQDQVVPSERVTRFVHIREHASSASREIGRLRPGERVEFVRRVPRWHEVRLADGTPGFVSKSWTHVVPAQPPGADNLVIHFLSVGAGTCTLVECPGPDAPPMFIDCGSTAAGRGEMALELHEATTLIQNILSTHTAAPNVVLTHGHRDHYGWIPSVLMGRTAQHIWRGGRPGTYASANLPQWIEGQLQNGATLHERFDPDWHNDAQPIGDDLSCGLASTYILNVNTVGSTSANSLILMIEYGDFTAIFPGDAPGITEDRAMANFNGAVKATVLAGSHHGASSHHSNDQDWADATAPEVVVYSSGTLHGHPRCAAVERYDGHLETVPAHPTHCNTSSNYSNRTITDTTLAEYVTDLNGTIVVTSTGRSPLSLRCESGAGCAVAVPH